MPNHCRCCSGKFLENDVLGDCPGCPECAKEAEWHKAIMEEACDAGERDEHCECVPVLRKACAEKEAEIARLTAVVEELQEEIQIQTDDKYALVSQMSALITERDALQAATRKVVEAASRWKSAKDSAVRGFSEREPGVMTDFMGASKALLEQSIAMDDLQAALADPVITTLRRE